MKYIKVSILVTLILPLEIFPSGGSYYSRYGFGDFYYSFTGRQIGFGELGIAASDYDLFNNTNPASWSRLRLTRFGTGMIFNGANITSNLSSAFHSQTIFTGLMIGFPISFDNGISLVGGIVPYSNVNYDVAENVDSNIVDKHKLSYKGEGGLSKIFLGLSYKLPFDFSLGTSFEYYTGKITHSTVIDFDALTTSFYDATYTNEYNYHGIGYSIGLISNNFASIIGIENLTDLRLGLTFSSGISLSTDSVSYAYTAIGTVENGTQSFKSELPFRLGIGLSIKWSDNYQFLLDYLYQPISRYSKNNIASQNIRDLYKLSLGFEYKKARPESQSFWEQVMLRCGLSYEQTQYSFSGTGINQASVYGGVSMPLGFDNTIDLGFQYGKRGTTDNNLLSENIYKFSITLSIGELWFIRQDR